MSLPLVSFVMPVYNAERYLKEAIDSVLHQSYKNIELVIINDGSTDSSKEIILSYNDSRIRYYENDQNSGIVYSRNKGLELSGGEYIATLDSDDIALPERAERQVNFLETNPDYGFCGTYYCTIDSQGKIIQKMIQPTDNRDLATHLLLGNCFLNSTIMIRGKLAKELKYKEKYDIVEDYELWYRVSKRAKITNLPIYGTYYRVHGNNISVTKMNDMFALIKKINAQVLSDLKIEYTDAELEIHSNLLKTDIDFFKKDTSLKGLETWIIKLYQRLLNEKKYHDLLLFKLIAEKWIVICFNTKMRKKIIFNRLFLMQKKAYLGVLFKRIYRKIIKN